MKRLWISKFLPKYENYDVKFRHTHIAHQNKQFSLLCWLKLNWPRYWPRGQTLKMKYLWCKYCQTKKYQKGNLRKMFTPSIIEARAYNISLIVRASQNWHRTNLCLIFIKFSTPLNINLFSIWEFKHEHWTYIIDCHISLMNISVRLIDQFTCAW